jgi:phage terminase small subunit
MKTNNLTIKQEAFCQAYIKYGDKTAAYREVYSCGKTTAKSISELACRLSGNVKVASRIAELQSKVAKVAEEKFQITAEEMLRHLNILRNSRIDEYVTLVYERVEDSKIIFGERPPGYEPTYHEEVRAIFKPFDELTKEQLMCVESIKVNRYGEVELKLHGKEWTIEKINKHIGFYEKDNAQKKPEITNEIDVSKLSNKALDELEKAYNDKK